MRRTFVGALLVIGFSCPAPLGAAGQELSLVNAVKAGNREAVRALLKRPATINVPEADGSTALSWAVRGDDVETAQLLIRAGANVKVADRYGITPLALAALNGHGVMAEMLLQAGADPNVAEPEGETPLMTAARSGSVPAVRTLLAHGANVNATEGWLGETALMMAAAENHPAVVKMLLEAGAAINARSKLTNLPDLEWDVAGMSTTVFPRGSWTPLMFTAQQGATASARVITEWGADLNLQDPDGTTALVLAIINAHYDVAALLLEKGADPNVPDSQGMAALYAAVDMSTLPFMHNRPAPTVTGPLEIGQLLEMLIAHGANPNAQLKKPVLQRHHNLGDRSLGDGSTPLMRAAKATDIPVMRILLSHGADAKLLQKSGTNALMIAAARGETGGYGRLKGGTEKGAVEAIKLLLDAGLDINAANNEGQTALHGTATRSDDVTSLIQFLVDRGANPNLKNKGGLTPLDVARGGARTGLRVARNENVITLLTQLTSAAPATEKKSSVPETKPRVSEQGVAGEAR